MTSILLYWNHICVLHRQEKAFLEDLAQRLRGDGIRLEVRYFGLGYPERMSEYLARPDAILPDLIVSADLEVFEDLRIFSKFKSNLYPAADWVPLRQSPMLNAVQRGPCLLPFVSIPLVYYTREPEACAKTSLPDWRGLAFGGINNSAAKTVVKSVWERWPPPSSWGRVWWPICQSGPFRRCVRGRPAPPWFPPSMPSERKAGRPFSASPRRGRS